MRGSGLASLVGCLGLVACATYFPSNDPLEAWRPDHGYRAERVDQGGDSKELVLALAFSGGGTRAAAFAFGVLEELGATRIEFDGHSRRLIDEIDAVSGVSGGSFTAGYLAIHGSAMLETFPTRVLERNIQRALMLRLLWPMNWLKLFSPYWARSDLAANYYDGAIFERATFGDLLGRQRPFVQIHATDLTTGNPFAFIQEQFDYLCSDLSTYPIARAVAASSAVPVILSPITLRNYTECGFTPPSWVVEAARQGHSLDRAWVNANNLLTYFEGERRYVRLIDGGVSDNLGVRGPFEAWFQRRFDPPEQRPDVKARQVVLVIVNAATTPDVEWDRFEVLPPLFHVVDAATSAQINRYNFETIELLSRTFELWNERTARWKPPLRYRLIELSFLDVGDEAERRSLNRLGTSLHLPKGATERLRSAARQALRAHPEFAELLRALEGAEASDP